MDETTLIAQECAEGPREAPEEKAGWFRLFDTSNGMRRYILRAWLLSLIPSLVIASLLSAAGLMTETPASDFLDEIGKGEMVMMVLLMAPFLETLLLSATLGLLGFFVQSRGKLLAASAAFWALLHLPNGPLIPLVIAWPFFVFSAAYLAWRPRGWLRAIAVVTAIHFLQNLLPALALLAT